jgi:alpha-tubulin suppressor-like RCC1 family protein
LALAALASTGCSDANSLASSVAPRTSGGGHPLGTGTVSLALTLTGGVTIDTVEWVVSDAVGSAVEQGTFSDHSLSFQIGGIPAGMHYSVSIAGAANDGSVTCAGAASFDIVADSTTQVVLPLQCVTPEPDSGSLSVEAVATNCATLDSVSATAIGAEVGESISLISTASGPAPRYLTYAWSAPSGTFAPSSSYESPNFTCTQVGDVAITLTVADGPLPEGGACDPARSTATIHVRCDAVPAAVAIAGGGNHNCLVTATGELECWGSGISGELGDGVPGLSAIPVTVAGLSNPIAIALGDAAGDSEDSCAVLSDHSVACWGAFTANITGNPFDSASPIPIPGVAEATAVAAGAFHTCAVVAEGRVECWGQAGDPALGEGTITSVARTQFVLSNLTGAIAVAAGDGHTCALLGGGTIKCWGANYDGQLGTAGVNFSSTPVDVPGITSAVAVYARSTATCALLADATVDCWGNNLYGIQGNGPTPVAGISGATAITMGTTHACALVSGGTIACWGDNHFGQLGTGDTTESSTSVLASVVTGVTAIAAGDDDTCVIVGAGKVKCWGYDAFGQLGQMEQGVGGNPPFSSLPIELPGF